MKTKRIQNCGILHQPEANKVVIAEGQDIFIRGNKIEHIVATGALDSAQVDEIIPARGMVCLPGLVNTHAHIPMVLFRGLAEDVPIERWFNEFIWPMESNLTEEDVYWGAQLALVEMIECGVTTVADHYFYMDRVAEAVEQAGTRAVLGWASFGSQGEAMLARTAEFAQKWQHQANGRITTVMAPHAPYTCDDAFLKTAVAHAKQLGVGIHIHAAENVAQTTSSLETRGQTPHPGTGRNRHFRAAHHHRPRLRHPARRCRNSKASAPGRGRPRTQNLPKIRQRTHPHQSPAGSWRASRPGHRRRSQQQHPRSI
ncbi:MAG: amidohydrolase family protein [Anaerolineales bacterium]|nr:amidohydrolase family protein [Anaerolineales bacterium]